MLNFHDVDLVVFDNAKILILKLITTKPVEPAPTDCCI